MIDDEAIQLALRTRLLTVSGLPAAANRVKVNKQYVQLAGVPYLEEDFVPSPPILVSTPGQGGTIQGSGLYVIRWYGIADKGSAAIRAGVQAILAKFTIGTTVALTNGDAVRIGTPTQPATGAYAGQIRQAGAGFAVCTISIPYWLLSQNVIAA
jgi:hypothetical protein